LLEFLGFSNDAAAGEMGLEDVENKVKEEYQGRQYLYGKVSRGNFDLSLCRIREI